MSLKKLLDLSDRVALVTGGSRGLGLQMAEALGEMGAKLALTARKRDELDAAASRLRAQGCEVEVFPVDLQQPTAAETLVGQVMQRFGGIDILVNNAGATWGAKAEDHPMEGWNKVINLNLTAVFALTQAVGKLAMIPKQRGRIINVASVAGLRGTDPRFMSTLAYNTSKGGLVNFTRALASEWGPYGITVNAIAPGVFPTKMAAGMIDWAKDFVLDRTPLRRLGTDQDLKGIAALLASDASAYITGQIIAVDGGMTAL
ncbi:MAG: SDR family oxidoreductase [Betaproteobacteria bacterium]|nr:SDR family oxidoreductase [Betaproteobacteria bacterium]